MDAYGTPNPIAGLPCFQYSYRPSGELLSKYDVLQGSTTAYDNEPAGPLRTVGLPDGRVVTYEIDPAGRRIGKWINGTKHWGFVYDGVLRIAAELDGVGAVRSTFVYGTRPNVPDLLRRGTSNYRIVTDSIGSVRLVIDSSTGAIAQRLEYDEFGNVLVDTNPGFQPFGFAGGLYDPDTALVRFGVRDYDPVTGRWTSADPVAFGGQDTNLYAYVYNDPVNLVDPTGELAWVAAGAAIGAGINVGMTLLANGGDVTGRQLAAAAASGAISGALGALAGPFGGTIARAGLGLASNGLAATAASTGLSAIAGGAGQVAANLIDECNASSVGAAALYGGLGGGLAKHFFPTKNLNTLAQALDFGPTTFGGLFGTTNAMLNLGSFATSSAVGGSANFPAANPF